MVNKKIVRQQASFDNPPPRIEKWWLKITASLHTPTARYNRDPCGPPTWAWAMDCVSAFQTKKKREISEALEDLIKDRGKALLEGKIGQAKDLNKEIVKQKKKGKGKSKYWNRSKTN